MADTDTNTELCTAKSVFSVIDEEIGDCVITIVRWNTGHYARLDRDKINGNKRLKGNVEGALILLANATQPVAMADL